MSPSALSGSFNLDRTVTGCLSARDLEERVAYTAPGDAAPGWWEKNNIWGMTRVDSQGLEAMYAQLVGMGPDKVTTLWSAIEEVKNECC